MELTDIFHKRRSTRDFSTTPVPRETLLQLVDVVRHSPSGTNKCPWHFVIVTERDTLHRLSQTHPHCRWLNSAKAGIAIVADPAITRYWLEDCCIVAYSIWLAATAQGLGVAWAAMYQSDNTLESARRQSFVREVLSVPNGFHVPVVLGIGYPKDQVPEKTRPSLEEIVHWEHYTLDSLH